MRPYVLFVLLILTPALAIRWSFISLSPNALTGRVIHGRDPVAGARVRVKGQLNSTLTDSACGFRLACRPNVASTVTAWKEGYFIGSVLANHAPLTIQLTALPEDDHENYHWVDPRPDAAAEHNCG